MADGDDSAVQLKHGIVNNLAAGKKHVSLKERRIDVEERRGGTTRRSDAQAQLSLLDATWSVLSSTVDVASSQIRRGDGRSSALAKHSSCCSPPLNSPSTYS